MPRRALLVGALVSGIFLVLFVARIDRGAVLAALSGADLRWLAAAALLQLPFYGLKVVRWRLLFPAPAPAWLELWDSTATGFAANCVLPGRAGELIRVGSLAARTGVALGHAIASLVIERLLDLVALMAILALGSFAVPLTPGLASARSAAVGVAGIALAALPVLGLIGARPGRLERLAARPLAWLPTTWAEPASRLVAALGQGLAPVASVPSLAGLVALSLVHWALPLGTIHCVGLAVGVGIGAAGSAIMQGSIAFAVALPQAPGFLGPFQWAAAETLAALGHPPDKAAAVAIAYWAVGVGSTLALGAEVVGRRGVESVRAGAGGTGGAPGLPPT